MLTRIQKLRQRSSSKGGEGSGRGVRQSGVAEGNDKRGGKVQRAVQMGGEAMQRGHVEGMWERGLLNRGA